MHELELEPEFALSLRVAIIDDHPMAREWTRASLQAAERNAPPLPPEEADRLWRSGPLGDEGLRIRAASGLEIIEERFQDPYVRAFIAWVERLGTLQMQTHYGANEFHVDFRLKLTR